MPKIEKDRSKAVQSGLWMIWDIYRLVLVSVLPKIGKRPDWTRLSSTIGTPYSNPGTPYRNLAQCIFQLEKDGMYHMQKLLISFCFFDSQKLIIYLCISNVFLVLTNTVMPTVISVPE